MGQVTQWSCARKDTVTKWKDCFTLAVCVIDRFKNKLADTSTEDCCSCLQVQMNGMQRLDNRLLIFTWNLLKMHGNVCTYWRVTVCFTYRYVYFWISSGWLCTGYVEYAFGCLLHVEVGLLPLFQSTVLPLSSGLMWGRSEMAFYQVLVTGIDRSTREVWWELQLCPEQWERARSCGLRAPVSAISHANVEPSTFLRHAEHQKNAQRSTVQNSW
jgi:hypothetical protein